MSTHTADSERSETSSQPRSEEAVTSTPKEQENTGQERESDATTAVAPTHRGLGDQQTTGEPAGEGRGQERRAAELQQAQGNQAVARAAAAMRGESGDQAPSASDEEAAATTAEGEPAHAADSTAESAVPAADGAVAEQEEATDAAEQDAEKEEAPDAAGQDAEQEAGTEAVEPAAEQETGIVAVESVPELEDETTAVESAAEQEAVAAVESAVEPAEGAAATEAAPEQEAGTAAVKSAVEQEEEGVAMESVVEQEEVAAVESAVEPAEGTAAVASAAETEAGAAPVESTSEQSAPVPGGTEQTPTRSTSTASPITELSVTLPEGPQQSSDAGSTSELQTQGVQPKLRVGAPDDEYEREADAVANAVTAGRPAPDISADSVGGSGGGSTRRQETAAAGPLPTAGGIAGAEGSPIYDSITDTIENPGAGRSIPHGVRGRIESSLGTSLDGVKIHNGPDAARAATGLGARALTRDNHIFLGGGESPHDVELLAHEATHVVQQGAASDDREGDASAAGTVQRFIPDWARRKLNKHARHIPGWTLFTVIIGYNPLLGESVDPTPLNLVEGLMGLIPFGTAIFDKLQEFEILQDAFEFVKGELNRANLSLSRLKDTIEAAWEDVSVFKSISSNLDIVKRHFMALYEDVKSFASSVVDHILELIKGAVIDLAESLLGDTGAWELLTKILGRDPLRGEDVEATPTEILEDFLILIGKEQHLEQMRKQGVVEETANWIATQIQTFMELLGKLGGLIEQLWETIQPRNLPNLVSNVESLVSEVGTFLQDVWDFASTVASEVLARIKDALLGFLATYVNSNLPGFDLLTVIIGRNPFTGEKVPRTPENIIRGFITLLPGGAAIYQKLAESGVVAEAGARIQAAIGQLGLTWEYIVGIFRNIWENLSIESLIEPISTFEMIIGQLREPVFRLFSFIKVVLREVFTVLLAAMDFPSELLGSIISNAMQAFQAIRTDPIGFVLNMLSAVKLGFQNFFANILTHIGKGLVDWLFRGLRDAGIEPPTDFTLASVLDFVLEVMGITTERLWAKLGERIGQDNVERIRGAIDKLTGIWNFVSDVQERGMGAIWEYIQSQISGLWDMVLQKAQDWVIERVINRAIRWLGSLLDPTGIMAVVNSFTAFFNAIQSAAEYAVDILRIINDYVSTIAAVASGELAAGAAALEEGLANAIPVAIGFLANQFGLGNIGEKIQEIVAGIRDVIDRALDWLMDKAESALASALAAIGIGKKEKPPTGEEEGKETGVVGQVRTVLAEQLGSEATLDDVQSAVDDVRERFKPAGLTRLEIGSRTDKGEYPIFASASPTEKLFELAPPDAYVKMAVTMRLEGEQPPAEGVTRTTGFFEGTPKQTEALEGRRVASIAPVPAPPGMSAREERAYRKSGGVLAEPEEGSQELEMTTWSTGAPIKGSNISHAERQFVEWLQEQEPSWRKRLQHIEIHLTHSPCGTCASYLTGVLTTWAPQATGRIVYDKLHTGQNPTTKEDISKLTSSEWEVVGETPPGKPEKDLSSQIRVIVRKKKK